MIELERQRAAAVVLAVERLISAMRAAGEPDPLGTLRSVLLLNDLAGAAVLPLLQVLEEPRAVLWAPEVRALLVTFDLGDHILARRLVSHAIEIVSLFETHT